MSRKKILVTGANGLLGQKVSEMFANESDHILFLTDIQDSVAGLKGFDYAQLDITKKNDVKNIYKAFEPDVTINCAAFTNVDACEIERELSWRINVDGVKNLLFASHVSSSKIVHVSSDYIFDGRMGNYDESSVPNPLSFYGKEKLASENAVITSGIDSAIVRTMIIYGNGINVKPNFALWLINTLGKKEQVNIVTDQFGQPTIVDDIALGILRIVNKERRGIYNISGSEYLSRFEFAKKVCEIFKFDQRLLVPIVTADLDQSADRPMNSSFILLKSETELGMKTLNVTEGLHMLKLQLDM